MCVVRVAKKSEIEWINQCYDEVEFVHSNFDKEIIAVAEFNNHKAGIGRLVRINSDSVELGGIYVFDAFRGKGVARKIVEFLLQHVQASEIVYCIPFEHLVEFYKRSGFVPCSNLKIVPQQLLDKYQWCKEKYTQPISLLLDGEVTVMNGVDLIVINSGVGFLNTELDWPKERKTIEVNVYGFCALAGVAFNYFSKQGHGHLVGISSIAALRGNPIAPAYNASKAFMSNYLEGLRKKAFKNEAKIIITDIRPGFVDTEMAKGEGKFWVAPPSKAAEQIYSAIQSKKSVAYITHRWRVIGWLLNVMPQWIYNRVG